MSSKKRSLIKTILTANGGCGSGCGCTKPKPSQVHVPSPKPKISINHDEKPNLRISLTNSSSTSGEPNAAISPDDDVFTCTSFCEPETDHNKNSFRNIPIGKKSPKLVDSVAVEKDSEDPYKDFQYSMLQMIFEREIYSEADLQDLLQCFLQLNPPSHHDIILRAFADICEEAFPKKKKPTRAQAM